LLFAVTLLALGMLLRSVAELIFGLAAGGSSAF
jgi:hypothetical protein